MVNQYIIDKIRRYTGDMQPNEVAAPLFWNAAWIVSPEAHKPRNCKYELNPEKKKIIREGMLVLPRHAVANPPKNRTTLKSL